MSPKTQVVVEFMKANLHQKLSLSEMANSVNLSRSHLCYLFKTQTGMSPGKYFFMLKMQKACELLATSPLNIKQIMAIVGYNDKSHFVRHFKKAYGLTPSQYRAQHIDLILAKDYTARQRS